MAKLKKIEIYERSNDDLLVEFTSQVEVDKEGTFTATFDPAFVSSVRSVAEETNGVEVFVDHLRGKVLEDVEGVLRAAAKRHLECEIVDEFVICRVVDNVIAYVVDEDAGVVPTGDFVKNWYSGRSNWKGVLNASSSSTCYRIGFGAQVFRKRTFLRPKGSNVVYEKATKAMLPELDTVLNCFVGLTMNPRDRSVKEMPYTLEAATFFHETMLSMCRMAEAIDGFFGDDGRVSAAIAGGGGQPLLAGTTSDLDRS